MNDYNEKEKKALSNFVTSTENDIYAVKNLRPEIFGAFGSFFSRSPKDVREHLLDAIKGEVPGHELEGGEERLEKLAASHNYLNADEEEKRRILESRSSNNDTAVFEPPQEALESGLEKAQDFFEKYYGSYGHKSIANTVWIPFVGNYVSQLFARKLADDQLAFWIAQSTRYVEFEDNYYEDPEVLDSKHEDLYTSTLEQMIENYQEFAELSRDFYRKRIPFKDWEQRQSESIREKSKEFKERKYEREINAKALDIARFLLPQAIQTNIAWILDARSTEFDIAQWKGHPLSEINEAAEKIEEAAGKIAPSILKYTEKNEYYERKLHEYDGELEVEDARKLEKGVDIISKPDNLLEKVVAHFLKQNNAIGFSQAFKKAKEMSYDEKLDVLETVSEQRGQYDEWIGANEEFDLEKITLEMRTDIGALRDMRRHQKNDRGENRYSLDMGHYRPEVVEEMPQKAQNLFDETIEISHEAEKEMRDEFPFRVQYLMPMACMTTITFSLGLDQLQYIIYTRSTPEGNFSYREDTFNLAEAAVKEMPWLLGLKEYPEEKSIQEVYEESDWKEKILWMSTKDTGLHT